MGEISGGSAVEQCDLISLVHLISSHGTQEEEGR